MKWTVFALLAISTLCACSTSNGLQRSEKLAETERAIASSASQKRLKIDVVMAHPMSGNAIPVSDGFALELRGDSVVSRLPYFGRAYSAPMIDGNAFDFAVPVADFADEKGKNGALQMTFTAKTIEGTFRFRVEVFGNGQAYIHVTTQKRQPISYDGDVVL